MATGELDIDKIQRQLAVLMTNSVDFQSKMFDLFVSSTPMDVEVRVWTSENTFETIKVPNRAKGNIPAQFGGENPEGKVEASYGTIYINETDGKLYIKTTISKATGWEEIVTSTALEYHNSLDPNAHQDTLAKVHGDHVNYFEVADIDDDSLDSYAVNKASLFKLLGGLETLKTEDKTSIVNAVNEVVDLNQADVATAITVNTTTAVDITSNKAKLLYLEPAEGGVYRIKIIDPFVAIDCKGIKHTCPSMSIKTTPENFEVAIKATRTKTKYSVFVSFEEADKRDGEPTLVVLPGEYYVSVHKPYLMQEKDTWLDIGNTPYSVKVMERNNALQLELVERNYVFLGTVEEVYK